MTQRAAISVPLEIIKCKFSAPHQKYWSRIGAYNLFFNNLFVSSKKVNAAEAQWSRSTVAWDEVEEVSRKPAKEFTILS